MSAHDISLRLNLDRDAAETFFNAMVSLGLLIKDKNLYFNTENGKSYSSTEIETWLKEAGFQNLEKIKIFLPRSIAVLTGGKIVCQ